MKTIFLCALVALVVGGWSLHFLSDEIEAVKDYATPQDELPFKYGTLECRDGHYVVVIDRETYEELIPATAGDEWLTC